jgi:hypothetical protein
VASVVVDCDSAPDKVTVAADPVTVPEMLYVVGVGVVVVGLNITSTQ